MELARLVFPLAVLFGVVCACVMSAAIDFEEAADGKPKQGHKLAEKAMEKAPLSRERRSLGYGYPSDYYRSYSYHRSGSPSYSHHSYNTYYPTYHRSYGTYRRSYGGYGSYGGNGGYGDYGSNGYGH